MLTLTKRYQAAQFSRNCRFFWKKMLLIPCMFWFTASLWAEEGGAKTLDQEILRFTKSHAVQKMAPSIPVYNEAGEAVPLESWEGQLVILHFWASWCSECHPALSSMNRLEKQLRKQQIQLIPVSVDYKGIEAVKKFYEQHKLTQIEMFTDPKNTLYHALDVNALPTSFVINEEGKVIRKITGSIDWEHPKILQWLVAFKAPVSENVPKLAPRE